MFAFEREKDDYTGNNFNLVSFWISTRYVGNFTVNNYRNF